MDRLNNLHAKLHSLAVFRGLLDDSALRLLSQVLGGAGKPLVKRIGSYAAFASCLFQETENLTDYIWDKILWDENPYIQKRARGEEPGPLLEQCVSRELAILQEIALLAGEDVQKDMGYTGYLASWQTRPADFAGEYARWAEQAPGSGVGVYAKHHVFSAWNGCILPVKLPDPVRLAALTGYERQQRAVVANTLAFLAGHPAANVLLYGDAGTGKSSTVKAIANEYRDLGLRLVEVKKDQLSTLPRLMESLAENPLKFILFTDDLSFSDREELGTLKAILEGTVSARPKNVVLYATSNRRHLIHETFSARGDDDVHAGETIQEQVSLSDRFGLSIGFFKPDKEKYLAIVHALAKQHGLAALPDLETKAERHALERGGRSPRTAFQFIVSLLGENGQARAK